MTPPDSSSQPPVSKEPKHLGALSRIFDLLGLSKPDRHCRSTGNLGANAEAATGEFGRSAGNETLRPSWQGI